MESSFKVFLNNQGGFFSLDKCSVWNANELFFFSNLVFFFFRLWNYITKIFLKMCGQFQILPGREGGNRNSQVFHRNLRTQCARLFNLATLCIGIHFWVISWCNRNTDLWYDRQQYIVRMWAFEALSQELIYLYNRKMRL